MVVLTLAFAPVTFTVMFALLEPLPAAESAAAAEELLPFGVTLSSVSPSSSCRTSRLSSVMAALTTACATSSAMPLSMTSSTISSSMSLSSSGLSSSLISMSCEV